MCAKLENTGYEYNRSRQKNGTRTLSSVPSLQIGMSRSASSSSVRPSVVLPSIVWGKEHAWLLRLRYPMFLEVWVKTSILFSFFFFAFFAIFLLSSVLAASNACNMACMHEFCCDYGKKDWCTRLPTPILCRVLCINLLSRFHNNATRLR